MTPPQEPPDGCQEIPGYILPLGDGRWLTKSGQWTRVWERRWVWATADDAQQTLAKMPEVIKEELP